MDREKYKEFARSGAKRDMKARAKLEDEGHDGQTLGYTSSDDSDGPRMDVEYISLLDEGNSEDEDGDKAMSFGSSHWGAGAPVRVPRSEHIDRTAMVNTDASTKKGKFDPRIKNESPFEDSVKVKDEPADDNMITEWPSSPEASRKTKASASSPGVKKKEIKSSTNRRRSSSNKTKPLFTSAETKEESRVEEKDRLKTLEELAGSFTNIKLDKDGDVGMVSISHNTRSYVHILNNYPRARRYGSQGTQKLKIRSFSSSFRPCYHNLSSPQSQRKGYKKPPPHQITPTQYPQKSL